MLSKSLDVTGDTFLKVYLTSFLRSTVLITFQFIRGLTPRYRRDLVQIKSSSYGLRSNYNRLLKVSPINSTKTPGDWVFMMAAPRLWNALPEDLMMIDNFNKFKRLLKTHLFKLAYS